jgi:hypothetical protein
MTMAEIPKFFQNRRDYGEKSHLHPFSYRSEDGVFVIASAEIAETVFDPYGFNPYRPELGIDPEGIDVDDVPNHPLMIPTFGKLLAGPKLHDWAKNNPSKLLDTYKIMHKVCSAFFDDPSQISDKSSVGHMGFASGPREDGGIHLQVLGDCACLGPDPHSLYVKNQFENGYAEYDLHNADYQYQRVGLYAGLGHIARLAMEK